MKKRHAFFYTALRPLTTLFVKLKFGYTYKLAEGLPENYIVLSNHTTDYDMLFVASSFPKMMYFVGSEHIARWKLLYAFLKFAFDPIMRPKGASAMQAVKEMLRVTGSGGNVCLFAEGVRSWDGTPSPITQSTAKLVKRMNCGLVTYRIIGGYFASPMWSTSGNRRGSVHGEVMHVYTSEQLKAMSNDEVYAAICSDLGEDAYKRQLASPKSYKSNAPAEGLENLIYICEKCGGIDTFETHGKHIKCRSCGARFEYDDKGMLTGSRFNTLTQYHTWQKEQTLEHAAKGITYTAPHATLSTVAAHTETPLDEGALSMNDKALRCGSTEFNMQDICELATHGRHALVFTVGKAYYEIIVDKGVSALKFFIYYNKIHNLLEKAGQ